MAFDATVLCRALLNPHGLEFELLVRAGDGIPFRGFTNDVAGMEFLRNAYAGFGAGERFRRYAEHELEEFLNTFAPLFAVDNIRASPLGRALTPNHALHDRPVGEVIHAMTGQDDTTLLKELEAQPKVTPGPSLRHFDPFDLHLALVAVRDGAPRCARRIPPTTRWSASDPSASPPRGRSPRTTRSSSALPRFKLWHSQPGARSSLFTFLSWLATSLHFIASFLLSCVPLFDGEGAYSRDGSCSAVVG